MRVKTGTVRHRKHIKILDQAKGYRMGRHRLFKQASESVLHAGNYAFAGRKQRKRDFRQLWIERISAALNEFDLSYSKFTGALKAAKINLNRKMLADLALNSPQIFAKIVEKVKVK